MPHTLPPSSFTGAGSHLRVDGVSFSYPDRRVLTDVSFILPAGDRAGLIGENGSGKSTLLRVIAGLLEASAGTVAVNAPGANVPKLGLLHQEFPFSTTDTVTHALEAAVAPARQAARAVNERAVALATCPGDRAASDAYASALETAEHLGAWDVDARISVMLAGLGLSEIDRSRPTGSLSGGQRARLALAWLLLKAPDVLLLDEPTNHLDDAATAFLTRVLLSWRGPVLIASHDRAFLDETATTLIDLDPSPIPHAVAGPLVQDGPGTAIGATRFTGTYSDHLKASADARRRWEHQYRDEQAELSRLRANVKDQQTVGHTDWKPRAEVRMAQKYYADRNARVVARRVNDARSRLAELSERQIRKPPQVLEFVGLTAAGSPTMVDMREPVLTATNVAVRGRLTETSVTISRGEKWLITGPNGSGKSTLLSVLAGTLEPRAGHVARSPKDRIRVLTQETTLSDPRQRGPGRSAAQAYTDLVGARLAAKVPLATFGLIAPRDLNRPVAELSVGQQRRLALATILAAPPEILLLDEPTNHFSLHLVTALEEAILDYPGTIVVASHDRWLRNRWTGRQFELSTIQ